MTIFILSKINYRNITHSYDFSGENIGIRLKDGTPKYYSYLGFIGINTAKFLGGRPVKIISHGYKVGFDELNTIEAGSYIQGCLFEKGVFAVLDATGSKPRII